MDRGFFSDKNINDLLTFPYKADFIMGFSATMNFYKNLIEEFN
jgi:predicted glycosyltransferase